MGVEDRADALAADARDPLAAFRGRFAIPDDGPLYVDGNSLGRPPRQVREVAGALLDTWERELVGGWEEWIGLPLTVGDHLGASLLGARPGETVVCDSVSVNLFKLARAALTTRSGAILVDATEFPTDRWVLDGLDREVRPCSPEPAAVAAAAGAGPIALAVFSLVHYRSGARADLRAVTEAVHAAGGLVLWDLSHAVGSIAIDLAAAGADLAVGCTYKYLGGGPGAPGFLWVRGDLLDGLRSPIQGWFGAAEPFAMGPAYAPAAGVARFLAGTPPVVALALVRPGVDLLAEAGMAAVAAKGAALTQRAIDLHDAWLAPLGFTLATPRQPERRGAHVALAHPDAWRICRALIERRRVIPDFRRPDVVRFGFPALTTSHAEVHDAMAHLRDLVTTGEHHAVAATARRVT